MNTVTKLGFHLPLAAIILTASIAMPALAQKQVPFKGALQGVEIDTPHGGPPPVTISVDGTATGIGSHVGQFSFRYQLTVTDGTATGSAQLTAANGDIIYTTVAGSSEQTSTPGVVSITE